MAVGQMDPAHLEGDALQRWYLRSPSDVEQERQATAPSLAARIKIHSAGPRFPPKPRLWPPNSVSTGWSSPIFKGPEFRDPGRAHLGDLLNEAHNR